MLTLAAFASLAQLGSGLALALAIFIEPISMREKTLRRKIDDALKLVPKDGSENSDDRQNTLLIKLFDLNEASERAIVSSSKPLYLIKLGALVNFIALIMATVCPEADVNRLWTWVLLIICIAPIALGFTWLWTISILKFRDFKSI